MRKLQKKPAKKFHHGTLKTALIDAAKDVIQREGAEVVSLSALAKSLGVSQAACYRHFRDKEAFFTEVALDIHMTFGIKLREMIGRHRAKTKLARVAHSYVKLGTQQSELYRFLFMWPKSFSKADGPLYQAADRNFDIVLEAIDPSLDELVRRRMTMKLLTSLHGVVLFAQSGVLPTKIRVITAKDLTDDLVADATSLIAQIKSGER